MNSLPAFTLIRMGFFYDDEDLISRNIKKGKSFIQQGPPIPPLPLYPVLLASHQHPHPSLT